MANYQFLIGYRIPYSVIHSFCQKKFEDVRDPEEIKEYEDKIKEISSTSTKFIDLIQQKAKEDGIERFTAKLFVDSVNFGKSFLFLFDSKNFMAKSPELKDGLNFSVAEISTEIDSFCKDIIMEICDGDYKAFSHLYKKYMNMLESSS